MSDVREVRQADSRRSLSVPWFTAGLLSVLVLRHGRFVVQLFSQLASRSKGVTVTANLCASPDCDRPAPFGTLCQTCEGVWLRDRRDVVDEAEHLTDLAAQFAQWCVDHGQPDPFKD